MKHCFFLAAVLVAAACYAAEPEFKLVLEDSFDGDKLSAKIWNIEKGKRRDSMNSASAVDVKDGRLTTTTYTDEKGVTYCGFVTTRGKFTVTQGRVEARCRFSPQPGTQCAFWLQSPTYGRSGDPAKADVDGVEVDIMETHGLMKDGYQYALHWGSYKEETHRTSHKQFLKTPVGHEWHDYGCEWDDTGYRFTFDGRLVAADTKCPGSKSPEFLLFTSESNMKGWNGVRPADGYGPKAVSANKLEVDWVKAWTRVPAAEKPAK